MRLAISNIAWDTVHDEAMAALLQRHGVDAIDIAPSKYFPRVAEAQAGDITAVRAWWADRGIEITGMQALLFGTTGLNVFGEPAVQRALLQHLGEVCRIGGVLGAPRLVFGSPRNRDRSGLTDEATREIATDFFRQLGDIAAAQDVIVCLEPNPTRYGANFMTHSAETAAVVRAVNHPAIRMQFDAGALTMNGESPAQVLATCAGLIGHVHASEPDLLPLGDGSTDHGAMAAALRQYLPAHTVCIEMLSAKGEAPLASIDRAVAAAVLHYRP
jgi:sugar phosphate isomerase/epimerase